MYDYRITKITIGDLTKLPKEVLARIKKYERVVHRDGSVTVYFRERVR